MSRAEQHQRAATAAEEMRRMAEMFQGEDNAEAYAGEVDALQYGAELADRQALIASGQSAFEPGENTAPNLPLESILGWLHMLGEGAEKNGDLAERHALAQAYRMLEFTSYALVSVAYAARGRLFVPDEGQAYYRANRGKVGVQYEGRDDQAGGHWYRLYDRGAEDDPHLDERPWIGVVISRDPEPGDEAEDGDGQIIVATAPVPNAPKQGGRVHEVGHFVGTPEEAEERAREIAESLAELNLERADATVRDAREKAREADEQVKAASRDLNAAVWAREHGTPVMVVVRHLEEETEYGWKGAILAEKPVMGAPEGGPTFYANVGEGGAAVPTEREARALAAVIAASFAVPTEEPEEEGAGS